MGKIRLNEQELEVPAPRMKVSEIKELALVPAKDKLYDQNGRLLNDNEVISTENTRFGAVTDWTRGVKPGEETSRTKPWECCTICGKPFRDGEEPAYQFDTGEEPGPLAAHAECLDDDPTFG